jgi:hypothetical protein
VRFFRVDRNRKWPSRNVGTNIAIVWAVNGEVKCPAVLDGKLVSGISQLLLSDDGGLIRPAALTRPKLVFKGDVFLGDGFLINGEKAAELLSKNSLERAVIHPFLNAMDLNSRVDRIGPNWIIDFGPLSKIEAKRHTGSWGLVEHLVKPEREKLDPKKYKWRRENWWRFASSSEELKQKLKLVKFAVAIPVTSKLMIPASVSSRQVFSSALAICPIESPSFFALISSWMHRSWAQWWGSKMRDDFRYSISDCFDTFPFCISNKTLDKLGKDLDEKQRVLAIKRDIGLTKLYNLVNSQSCEDPDIKLLRALHEKIDREVIKAFGLKIEIGEYELAEFKGLLQWGPPASQRIEILQLLLAENQRQHSEGVIEWPTK